MTATIEHLRDNHRLSAQEYGALLENNDPEVLHFLQREAQRAAVREFGRGIFIRGLLEISNHCRNNCLYCGIRAANTAVRRYRLGKEEILRRCAEGYALGFRTFVLQGGEDPQQTDDWVEDLVRSLHETFPDCAITLSLGEKREDALCRFRLAGADRYLLRHETFDPEHYASLHPAGMSRERRLECLHSLKKLGYQTGTGMMVGSPYQTTANLVGDLLFIQEFRPQMIGIGPFVHHPGTPLATFPDGSVELTLKLISILRLMNPRALIPATTALATLAPDGRREGILAGANVVMPNLTPVRYRGDYSLYEGKAADGAESAEGLEELRAELAAIGYTTNPGRGDYTGSETNAGAGGKTGAGVKNQRTN